MLTAGPLRGLLSFLLVAALTVAPSQPQCAGSGGAPTTDNARIDFNCYIGEVFIWYHTCPGDYNQDGLVNASDITPLGANLNVSALPDRFPLDTQYSQIDGDQNGVLTVADLSTIGAQFNADVLGGYNVYAADSLDDYPASNGAPSSPGAVLVENIPLAKTITDGDEVVEFGGVNVQPRNEFRFRPDDFAAYIYWWVRPVSKLGSEGTPSTVVTDPVAKSPRDDESTAQASWDAETSTLSWYYYNIGDYNCDGFVSVMDTVPVALYFEDINTGDPNTAAGMIDTDGSGMVDQGDYDAIEDHLWVTVDGYNVYAAAAGWYYPESNDARSLIEPLVLVDYSADRFPGVPYRPLVSVELNGVAPGTNLWVRPYDYRGYEGTPSNLVVAD